MIRISFAAAEIAFAVIWVLCRAAVWIKRRGIDLKRELALLLMFVDLAVVIRFVFFPMELDGGRVQPIALDPERAFPFWINLVPFKHLLEFNTKRELLLNVIGNAAMFVPSGIIFPILYRKLDSFPKVLGAGALTSLCIELLQLPFYSRASDVDDLILNTAGVAVGYCIYALFRAIFRIKEKSGE